MPDIHIPTAALEAGARAVHTIDRKIAGEDQWPAWEELSPLDQHRRLHRARAAFLAMVKAWPGSFEEYMNVEEGRAVVCMILPKGGYDD